jgi:hypothetical protein
MMEPLKRLYRRREPEPPKDPLRLAVAVHFKMFYSVLGITNPAEIREKILALAKQALENPQDAETKTFMVPRGDGESREEVLVSPIRVFQDFFRMMDVDRHDLHAKETLFARIERLITESLDKMGSR